MNQCAYTELQRVAYESTLMKCIASDVWKDRVSICIQHSSTPTQITKQSQVKDCHVLTDFM